MIGLVHHEETCYCTFLFLCLYLLISIIIERICDSKQLTNTPFNVKILTGDYNGEFCNYRWFELT